MKIYISTPVTSRKEETMDERIRAARARCWHLALTIPAKPGLHDAETTSVFDLVDGTEPEPQIMGRCIQAVMECDAIFMDHGWEKSRGCTLERKAAELYGKKIFHLDWMPDRRQDYED